MARCALLPLILAAAFRGANSIRSVKTLEDTAEIASFENNPQLTPTWRDLESDFPDLPLWKIAFCSFYGPSGSLAIEQDDPDFQTNCEKLYEAAAQRCTDREGYMALHPHKRAFIDGGFEELVRSERDCREFKREEESAKKRASIGQDIEKAVKLCEEEIDDVCMHWCETKAKIVHDDGETTAAAAAKCETTCTEMQPFKTGELECGDLSWNDCQERLEQQLVKSGRDKKLEAIMREMVLKCVCVARPPSGQKEGHKRCYNKRPGVGLMLEEGQKWCEWHNTPSWQPLNERWDQKFGGAPMPLPQCTEFPKWEGEDA